MNALQKKLSVATLLVGTIFGTVNLPSLAYDDCDRNWGRHQVMQRDNFLERDFNRDRGYLRENLGRWTNEDRPIRYQAYREAEYNGGYLSREQQRELSRGDQRELWREQQRELSRQGDQLQRRVSYNNNWF